MNKTLFGTLENGEKIYAYTIKSKNTEAEIITFGAAISRFVAFGKNIVCGYDNIEDYIKGINNIKGTFRVTVKRADKFFPINSTEFSKKLGEIILNNNPNILVDLHNYETEISVDIREQNIQKYNVIYNIKMFIEWNCLCVGIVNIR